MSGHQHSIYLNDILRRAGVDSAEVLLIRHPLTQGHVVADIDRMGLMGYTAEQGKGFGPRSRYWIVFLGEGGRLARFAACYENLGEPLGDGSVIRFPLADTLLFDDLRDRLIIDWGKGAIKWYQYASANPKPVISIADRQAVAFPGFEELVLSHAKLVEMITEPSRFAEWHSALRSVAAIYLITDSTSGRQYVGSASGSDGLLGRWRDYAKDGHGGNKVIKELLEETPDRYRAFRYSVLQVIQQSSSKDDILRAELVWKRKLMSVEFGLNGA